MIVESSLKPLNYDDVLFLPNHSYIDSRNDVNLYVDGERRLPIFSAPMKNISTPKMIRKLSSLGGVGILHRFFKNESERYEALEEIGLRDNFGVAIGLNNFENELKFVKIASSFCQYVVLDTASGYMQKNLDAVEKLVSFRRNNYLSFEIITGNVVTADATYELAKRGSDMIRVNIGSGGQCLTSTSISIGCPPLTAIKDCSAIREIYPDLRIIADGGINTPGRALQSFAFGATDIMIGSLFGKAEECENDGEIYGMSSYRLQEEMQKDKKSNEGRVTHIPKEEIRPLTDIFNEFVFGIKSGLSYLGIEDINKIGETEIEYIKVRG